MSGKCAVCEKDTTQQCSNCHGAFYCCKEHQKQDRKMHKINCKPVQIKQCQQLGRYLVASKDLKEGEILFRENPIVVGPPLFNLYPMCLGCHKLMSEEDSYCPCPKCGWPMCNEDCCSSPNHKPECEFIVAKGSKVDTQSLIKKNPLYQCVVVMRCLYLKNAEPEMWDKLMKLESHPSEDSWEGSYIPIVATLMDFFKIDSFTFEEMVDVCHIIMVNAFKISLHTGLGVLCIYNITSLLEHRCLSNCGKSFELVNNKVIITAAMNIKAGEHVSICYTDALLGTIQRRQELKRTKFFNCHCQRCEDVTEMGTMYGALKCQKRNCGGNVLPKSFILEDQPELDWFCNKCTTVLKSHSAEEIYNTVKEKYYALEVNKSFKTIEMFLRINSKYLSGTHEFIVRAKVQFGRLFNISIKNEILLENLTLTRKFAEDVSNVFDVLIPGEIEARGFVLMTLHQSWVEDFQRKMNNPEQRQCRDTFLNYLMHYKRVLQKFNKFIDCELHQIKFASTSDEISRCIKCIDESVRHLLISNV